MRSENKNALDPHFKTVTYMLQLHGINTTKVPVDFHVVFSKLWQ
jgi:hypothetical protein